MIGDKGTLDRIIDSATDLFLEYGYEGVGLREICRKADVTTGAFYRHFKGKKELFEAIAGDVYNELINIYRSTLKSFFELPADQQVTSMHDITLEAVDRMTFFMYEHKTEMTLILSKSEGTEFSSLGHELSQMDEVATDEFTEGTIEAGIQINKVHKDLESLLTEAMFNTYLELMKKDLPIEEMKECSHALIEFFEAGWWRLMGL